jgi:hypothetical protein
VTAKASALVFLFMVAFVPRVSATTARQLSNQALAAEADMIVVGRCADVTTKWAGRSLITVATVEVKESLRGGGRASVTVILPGGVDANRPVPVMMTFAGAPRIAPGEDVFLFLEDETATLGGYTIVGFSQGKFSIMTDASGQAVVSRDLTMINLQNGTGVTRGTHTLTRLREFREEIRQYLGNR